MFGIKKKKSTKQAVKRINRAKTTSSKKTASKKTAANHKKTTAKKAPVAKNPAVKRAGKLSELEKEKAGACIQYQINLIDRKIDKLNEIDRVLTNKEAQELENSVKATSFYKKLIQKIKNCN